MRPRWYQVTPLHKFSALILRYKHTGGYGRSHIRCEAYSAMRYTVRQVNTVDLCHILDCFSDSLPNSQPDVSLTLCDQLQAPCIQQAYKY